MSDVTVVTSKTKSGKTIRVVVIPAALVTDEGPERMHWRATALAQERGCSHYRVMSEGGQIVGIGKAGAQISQELAARLHGDGSDWER